MDGLLFHILYVVFGLIIGSFLSMCIYRIPLGRGTGLDDLEEEYDEEAAEQEEEDRRTKPNSPHFERRVTVLYPPRSFCPTCGTQLKWTNNIPVLSWVMQGGKCRSCKEKISVRYPLVELLSAFFCYLSFTTFGLSATGAVIYIFCCALIVISFIDLDYYIIPNVISYPGTLIGLLLALINQYTHIFTAPIVPDLTQSLLGILVGAGILLVISEGYFRLRKKQGLGLGDVKLLAMTGALFGMEGSFYTIFFGSLLGSVVGLALIAVGGRKVSQYLPFGPYLAVATLLYIFISEETFRSIFVFR